MPEHGPGIWPRRFGRRLGMETTTTIIRVVATPLVARGGNHGERCLGRSVAYARPRLGASRRHTVQFRRQRRFGSRAIVRLWLGVSVQGQ